jgi:hypothetical protein
LVLNDYKKGEIIIGKVMPGWAVAKKSIMLPYDYDRIKLPVLSHSDSGCFQPDCAIAAFWGSGMQRHPKAY